MYAHSQPDRLKPPLQPGLIVCNHVRVPA